MARLVEELRRMISFFDGDLLAVYRCGKGNIRKDDGIHLEAALEWLCRAQDASGDGGVARSYSLVYSRTFRQKGWTPSYPETTGYIIPTMFDYARHADSRNLFERAVRMAEWECGVQLENGAIQGGTVLHPKAPAIFNTGQVLFGWLRAYRETADEKYLSCARRAGEYLVSQQDDDGAWRKNLSLLTSSSMPFYSYNTRTAWGLLVLSTMDNSSTFRDSGIRNIEFSLLNQSDNGYFINNCLSDPSRALLHTIAYCLRGILESGILLDERRYIDKVLVAADSILRNVRSDGSLPGRFSPDWDPAVSWSCLTGNSQMAIIFGRLFQVTGDPRYLEGMKRINHFQKRIQVLGTENPDLRGGIAGSYPVHGSYGKFELLSWAAKFFVDALLLEKGIRDGRMLLLDLDGKIDSLKDPTYGKTASSRP